MEYILGLPDNPDLPRIQSYFLPSIATLGPWVSTYQEQYIIIISANDHKIMLEIIRTNLGKFIMAVILLAVYQAPRMTKMLMSSAVDTIPNETRYIYCMQELKVTVLM